MSSSISFLSLFVLILFNGCFSWPTFNQEDLTSTSSQFNNELTTENTFSLRLVSDNETSSLPDIHHEYIPMNMPDYNSSYPQTEQETTNINEIFTSSPITVTEIQSTTEHLHIHHHHRHVHDPNDHHDHDHNDGGDHQNLSSTTFPSITDAAPLQARSFEDNTEHITHVQHGEQPVSSESTTQNIFSTTQKHVDHFNHDKEHKHHHGRQQEQDHEESTKPIKTIEITSTSKSSFIDQHSDESSEEQFAPTVVFDQGALDKVSGVPGDIKLFPDESNTFVVTDISNKWKTSTMLSTDEAKPLNQGEESLHSEEKESSH